LFTWPAAKVVWMLVNLAALVVAVWGAGRFAGLRWREPAMWVLLIAALLFLPVHSTFRQGQPALLAAALIALALLVRGRKTPGWTCEWFGGLMVVLAAALKPQLGFLFVLYELYRLGWRGRAVMVGGGAAVGLASLAWLWWHDIAWLEWWRGNLDAFAHGGAGDVTAANPYRYQMLHLQPALTIQLGSSAAAQAVSLLALGIIAVWGLRQFRSATDRDKLTVNLLCILTLLMAYHRNYDAVILIIPMAWIIARLRERRDRLSWTIFALSLPILTGSATAVYALMKQKGMVPATDSVWWRDTLLVHTPWALLALAVVFAVGVTCCRAPAQEASTRSM